MARPCPDASSSQESSPTSTDMSKVLRRSSREKHAPSLLVLTGANSKTYSQSITSSATKLAEDVATEVATNAPAPRKPLATNTGMPSNNKSECTATQENETTKNLSQESSECDSKASISARSQPSAMITRFNRTKVPPTAKAPFAVETERPKRSRGATDLDETTLIAVKEFLQTYEFDTLDEDDVLEDTLEILKAVNSRAQECKPEFDATEYDSDDDVIFEALQQDEENYTVGNDLIKEAVSSLGQTPATKSNSKKSYCCVIQAHEGIKIVLDQKSVAWVRRVAGIQRHARNFETITKNSKAQQFLTTKPTRVVTRRYVNDCDPNPKKRHRGLDIMTNAIEELEEDFGATFPVYRFRSSPPKKKKSQIKSSTDNDKKGKKKENNNVTTKAKSHKNVDGPNKVSANKKESRHKFKMPSPRICTTLRVLDQAWRHQTAPRWLSCYETELEYEARKSIPLHPQFIGAGIIHKLPKMESLRKDPIGNLSKSTANTLLKQPLCENAKHNTGHTGGAPARFNLCNLFYSDLDREWYEYHCVCNNLTPSLL
jgi:hypothetical protein